MLFQIPKWSLWNIWRSQKWNLLHSVIFHKWKYWILFFIFFSLDSEECSNIGGTNGGSCAEGFGVCCISNFTLKGQMNTVTFNTAPFHSHSWMRQFEFRELHLLRGFESGIGSLSSSNLSRKFKHLRHPARLQHLCHQWSQYHHSRQHRAPE